TGVDFGRYSLGGLCPLRAQPRRIVARAYGGVAHDRADILRRGRLLPRQTAYAGLILRFATAGRGTASHRAPGRTADGFDRTVHGRLGHQARRRDLAKFHRRFSGAVGRSDLPADPDRRCDLVPVCVRASCYWTAAAAGAGRTRRCGGIRVTEGATMDIFVLLATMLACFVIGMPIAYSLALAAIAGAFWMGIPLEAVM